MTCSSAKLKWACPKVHCKEVSLHEADRTLWLQLSERTANVFHMLSNKCHNCVSLVTAKSWTRSVIRIKISIANEKLMQHVKNINPKMCILYRMKQFYRGDFSDFLPSLVLISHPVTVSRLGKAFILLAPNLHSKNLKPHCCLKQKWNLMLKLTLANTGHRKTWKYNQKAGPIP